MKNKRNIQISTVLTFFVVIAMLSTSSAEESAIQDNTTGFVENFSSPVLDPSWTVLSHLSPNTYSLTDNPGHLRYKLDAGALWDSWPNYGYRSDGYRPSLVLLRNFTGENWVLRAKVTYDFTQYTNGRQIQFYIVFEHNDTRKLTFLRFWRDNDLHQPGRNKFQVDFFEDGGVQAYYLKTGLSTTVPDTWYIEVTRHRKNLSVNLSRDGENWFEAFPPVTMNSVDSKQVITLEGSSWVRRTNSYADYDYIYVEPVWKVCIDPGHGGADPGAVGYNGDAYPNEEDINLDIALKLKALLEAKNIEVIMTRTTDTDVTLQQRCDIANNNNCDIFVSIHCNSHKDESAHGTETLHYPGSVNGLDLAKRVQSELVKQIGLTDRGTKSETKYVLENTAMPAVLTEVAFISNQSEFNLLNDPAFRQKAAQGIANGILRYLENRGLTITAYSPVDIIVTDPDGLRISKQLNEIPGATYTEADVDGDGKLDDQVRIPDRKIGDYSIAVIPEPYALSTDIYTLEVSLFGVSIILADNIQISDIPSQPYKIKSTETEINAAPIADANGTYTGIEGQPVEFSASLSYDPEGANLTYYWNFGDGETAVTTQPTISHTYTQQGNYTVTLIVNDSVQNSTPSITYALINDTEPKANFTANQTSGFAPLTVQFNDSSVSYDGITGWEWDFDGDGIVDSNEQNPIYTYDEAGTYTVSLTVQESDGDSDTETKTDYITVTSAVDTEPPTIESVTLDTYINIPNSTFHVTVKANDNVGIASVTADGINLTKKDNIWEGDIYIPPETHEGKYNITIIAEDDAGNFNKTTVYYSVVIPTGGLGVAILPKISSASPGSEMKLDINVVSTENFDDIVHINLTLEGILTDFQANLSWFNWTNKTVMIPIEGEIVLPIAIEIPNGTSPGYKSFGVYVESKRWHSSAQDYGAIMVG